MMVRGVGWRHGSGDAEKRIRLVVGGGAHAADDLVAVEEDVAVLLLEELEEVRAPPAAVRGAALVVRLGLLGDVLVQPRRARAVLLRVVRVRPERRLEPVDRVAQRGCPLRRRARASPPAGRSATAEARSSHPASSSLAPCKCRIPCPMRTCTGRQTPGTSLAACCTRPPLACLLPARHPTAAPTGRRRSRRPSRQSKSQCVRCRAA